LETFWPWGIATGDFDGNGFEDMFVPSGMGYPFFYWGNQLLLNQGNGSFAEQAAAAGLEPPVRGQFLEQKIGGKDASRSSRCAAVSDFRGLGRLDIVTSNFNDRPYYFQNHFPPKNYIAFRLQGTKSNRDAIGALVHVDCGQEKMVRQVHCAGGYLSHSSRTLHFGLGDRQKIDRVEVRWPSGAQQKIDAPEINKLHNLVEPSG
jgi:enediyne biosynthesis protein E4